jgi:hypothetical protein
MIASALAQEQLAYGGTPKKADRTAVAAICLAAASAAGAQPPPPGEPPGILVHGTDAMRSAYSGEQVVPRLYRLARCIVDRELSTSQRLLQTVPETREEGLILYGPIGGRLNQCAGSGFQVSAVLLRGALAQALYETQFPKPVLPSSTAETVPPIQWGKDNEMAATLAPVYELGRCAAASNTALVQALAATEPASPAEMAALAALMPKLQPCLDRGTTFRTNRPTLRAILVESLYKWSVARRSGGPPAEPSDLRK